MHCVLVRVSITVKRHHDHSSNSYKGNIYLGMAYMSRGLLHYFHDSKHGGMQGDMVLEKKPRALHLDQQAAERGRETLDMSI